MLAEFSIYPLDKGESLSKYVAGSLDIVKRSGLPFKVGPMGTVIEGDYDQVMAVIKECHMRMRRDCKRVAANIKIDDREGAAGRLDGKIESVEKKLGYKLPK
jgi:uncharacterized protein (TIGR00106 family)